MKKFLCVLLVLFALVGAAAVFAVLNRDWLIKNGVEFAVTRMTGFKTEVESIHVSLPTAVEVRGLTIKNPKGFHQEIFADIPEIYIALDLNALKKEKRIHLPEVRLNIQEIYVEKNEQGVSNVSLLTSAKKKKPEDQKPKKPAMPFMLDRLELTVRNVKYVDYTGILPDAVSPGKIIPKQLNPAGLIQGGVEKIQKTVVPGNGKVSVPGVFINPKQISTDLKIEKEVFTNIDKPAELVNLILRKVLYGKTLGNLKEIGLDPANLNLDLEENLKGIASSGKNVVGGIASTGKNVVGQTAGTLTQQTGGALKGAQGQVTGLLGKIKNAAAGDPSPEPSPMPSPNP